MERLCTAHPERPVRRGSLHPSAAGTHQAPLPCQHAFNPLVVGPTSLLAYKVDYIDSERLLTLRDHLVNMPCPMDPGWHKGPTGGGDLLGLKSTAPKDLQRT